MRSVTKSRIESVADSVWFRLVSRGMMVFSGLLLSTLAWLAPQWFDQKLEANARVSVTLATQLDKLTQHVEGLDDQNRLTLDRIGALEITTSVKGGQRDKQIDGIQKTLDHHSDLFNQIIQQQGEILGQLRPQR